jgi:3-hydroxy-9,10-secoandrosta-1,3,5(10)-triene-9,17-dione monooxygenase reductase component
MSTAPTLDPGEFRKALGAFATGVTIITTRAADGALLGLTANSFNSVSLNPPLVLWSLAQNALSLPVFKAVGHWAVHILAADQEELSARFARRGLDKFAGLDVESGAGGVPLLRGCTARFECRSAFQYEGGDHTIFVGEVLKFERSERAPLVFHGGRYAHATRRESADARPRNPHLAGSFNEDFLGYLLGRGHFLFFAELRKYLAAENLGDDEFYVLSSLTLKPVISESSLQAAMFGLPDARRRAAVDGLLARGLAREAPVVAEAGDAEFCLTAQGRQCALRLIAAAKAVESELLERLGSADAEVLKALLGRLLRAIDPAASALWDNPVVRTRAGGFGPGESG